MRKIIGFKLNLRIKEFQRRAKKAKVDLQALALDEPSQADLIERAPAKPAVLFDTFKHPDADQPLLSPMPGLAYSLVLATVGDGFRQAQADEPSLAPAWDLLEGMALDETVRFTTALIQEESSAESCELSPLNPLSEPAALEKVVAKLEAAKIGVTSTPEGLAPLATRALSLSWLSKSKVKGRPRKD